MSEKKISYKVIFHIDLNAFFASCAISANPSLANKAVVIAHKDPLRKSIILTASYEARKYGIKTTMQVREAIILYPQVVVIEPDYSLYQEFSNKFFKYLETISPKLEITSVDEGYLDVTEVCQNTDALSLAKKIQTDLLNLYKLPSNIGIAPNKFLAKMASNMQKPLGITILRKREVQEKLWPLPINAMMGVGRKTETRLKSIGIKTIKDAASFKDHELLEKTIGRAMKEYLIERANGNDSSEVNYELNDDISSISKAHTFSYNINNIQVIKDTIKVLSNTVSNRLMRRNLYASNIGIQLKFANFHNITRSRGLEVAINDNYDLWEVIEDLFDEYYDGHSELRLVGVFATRFSDNRLKDKQLSIFDNIKEMSKEEGIKNILNEIKNQYGEDSINIGFYKYEKEEN